MKKIYTILAGLMLMSVSVSSMAQDQYKMQSVFVYNFTRMIAWPQAYQSGDFVIAVYGNSPIAREFQELAATRMVGNQRIIVKTFNNIAEIEKSHILYVPTNQSRNINDIVGKLKSDRISALVVTDARNALTNGSVVNFLIEGGRQRYELSESNARDMGLNLGSEMARLAIR